MPFTITGLVALVGETILTWGWLFVLFLALWIAWETYMFLKHVDYTTAIQWTIFEIKLPDDAGETPKAFENAIEVWGGMHKDPDLVERLFEGYFLPWYSCELVCRQNEARYLMTVPTGHAKFIEGVIYGQYPTAEVTEVPDYATTFQINELEKTYDMWGSEIVLVKEDYYPIRTYHEFEDSLNEDDRYIDPHQSMVEAFSNVNEDEHFWVQILIKPMSAKVIEEWSERGQEKIRELAGQEEPKKSGLLANLFNLASTIPRTILFGAEFGGDSGAEEGPQFKFYNPSEDAEMKGILQKVSRTGFKTKIRVMHFAPVGKVHKPNYGKAIGAFKQFNTFNLNSLKPDSETKTNGPNFIMKQTRRRYRKRAIILNYQWRDFWGDDSGFMLTAEELATLYHLPIKYVRTPAVTRASAGAGTPPSNVPYT